LFAVEKHLPQPASPYGRNLASRIIHERMQTILDQLSRCSTLKKIHQPLHGVSKLSNDQMHVPWQHRTRIHLASRPRNDTLESHSQLIAPVSRSAEPPDVSEPASPPASVFDHAAQMPLTCA